MRLDSPLAVPSLFHLFNHLIGGSNLADNMRRYICPADGERILDLGCGLGDVLTYLPRVRYLGIDMNAAYIRAAARRFGSRGEFRCQRIGEVVLDTPGEFDKVLSLGVLMWLDDGEALKVFQFARNALKPGGKLIIMEGCSAPDQPLLVRYLLRKQRGKHVRTREDYVRLASSAFSKIDVCVRHDLLRVPYTMIILRCTS